MQSSLFYNVNGKKIKYSNVGSSKYTRCCKQQNLKTMKFFMGELYDIETNEALY